MTSNNFKVGDWVKWVGPIGSGCKKGHVYKVTYIGGGWDGNTFVRVNDRLIGNYPHNFVSWPQEGDRATWAYGGGLTYTATVNTEVGHSFRDVGQLYWQSDKYKLGWNYIDCEGYTPIQPDEQTTNTKEDKPMPKFVETATTTKVKEVINGHGSGGHQMSVKPSEEGYGVSIVIGANYYDRRACFFTKNTLGDLIEDLQAIHSAMKG